MDDDTASEEPGGKDPEAPTGVQYNKGLIGLGALGAALVLVIGGMVWADRGSSSSTSTTTTLSSYSASTVVTYITTTTAAPVPLQVVNSGFSTKKSVTGRNEVSFGALVKNPSTQTATGVHANFTLKSADGTVVGTETARHNYIAQGATAAMSANAYLNEGDPAPTRLEVQVTADSFEEVQLADFQFANLRYTSDTYFGKVLGTVKSPASKDVSALMVQCVVSKAGKPIGGGFTFVDRVAAGATASFEMLNGLMPGMHPDSVTCYGAIDR